MLKKLNSKRGGFTLVEIMIVVAIIALLASIAVPSFLRARKRSQCTKMLQELRLIDAAVDQYAIEYNLKPGSTAISKGSQLVSYIKANTGLSERLNVASASINASVEGVSYNIPVVDAPVEVDLAGADFSDVIPTSFWSPYSVK